TFVVRAPGGPLAGAGGDTHDSPGALLDHLAGGCSRAQEHAAQVEADYEVPDILGQLPDPTRAATTDDVDQDVDPPELLDRPVDQRLGRCCLSQVPNHRVGCPAAGYHGGTGLFQAVGVDVAADQQRALLSEADRDRAPDAARGAGDHRHAILNPSHARHL